MSESFGARLRRRREAQQIDLGTIAEETKIKQSLLEALERGDISHWPSGIFRRAFIRGYAHAINLDPDVVVREFIETFPEAVEVESSAAVAVAVDAARGNGGPPTRLRSLLGSAVGSLSRRRRAPAAGWLREDAVSPSPLEAVRLEVSRAVVDAGVDPPEPGCAEPDFTAIARLCTEFARVDNPGDVRPLLEQAARLLNALGIVVWVWDPAMAELRPTLAVGYSDTVVARLPNLRWDADNVTAVAFRSGQPCSIDGADHVSALVVPLLVPSGCAGALSFELRGAGPGEPARAAATILAAQLSQLIGGAHAYEDGELLTIREDFETPVLRAVVRA
jgi:transcriptional regulator with XRE-family HTH domain